MIPQDPPESTVVISLGTDTTDLVVTNGYRVWQRNIPIGGNHFHPGSEQGAEAHVRQGGASETQRHPGRRSQGRVSGDAARV